MKGLGERQFVSSVSSIGSVGSNRADSDRPLEREETARQGPVGGVQVFKGTRIHGLAERATGVGSRHSRRACIPSLSC
jgi:hypothetical protein